MAVIVVCPACGGKLSAPNQLIGRMAKCPQCGQAMKVVPSAQPPAPPTEAQAPSPRRPSGHQSESPIGHETIEQTERPESSSSSPRVVRGLRTLVLLLGIAVLMSATLAIGVLWRGWFGSVLKGTGPVAKQEGRNEIRAGPSQQQDNQAPLKPSEPKEPSWADASKGPVQHGDVRVRVTGVAVRNVRIKDVLGEETVSPTKNLVIQVEIFNTSSTRKLDFLGWSGATANTLTLTDLLGSAGRSKTNAAEPQTTSERNAASLTDNFNNSYKRMSLDLGAQIPGQITTASSLYPGKQLEDLLVFEPPIDKIQYLRLELPAAAFGGTGSLRLQIPRAMIHR